MKSDRGLRGSDFPRMNNHPTLIEFYFLKGKDGKPVRIIDRIGTKYHALGIYLLNDTFGTVLDTIEANANGETELINLKILKGWINGQGIKERDWKTLVYTLREGPKLNTLADDIVAALNQ